jgi:hypothetical protein
MIATPPPPRSRNALAVLSAVAALAAAGLASCESGGPTPDEATEGAGDEALGSTDDELVGRTRVRTIAAACDADPRVDARKSLVIADVANDPRAVCTDAGPDSCGPWSFGFLMAALAETTVHGDVSELVEDWLATWRTEQNVNGQEVEARPLVDERILDGWRRTDDGLLRFDDAPFKLIAIVNRFDLRDDEHYGGSDTAGEGRFIFGLYGRDAAGELTPAKALQFHVIFEHKVPAEGCGAKLDWARRVRDLSDLDGAAHRSALERVTRTFAGFGVADDTLAQIRVNEVELGTLVEGTTQLFLPWQLREFRLFCDLPGDGCTARSLRTVTTKQSVAKHMMSAQKRDALWEWVATYASDIANGGEYEIPETIVDGDGDEHDFLAAFDESYTNRGGILPLTPQTDPNTGELIPYRATCRVANNTCGGCHRQVDEGCDNYDEAGRPNPFAKPDLRTGFVMVSHLRPPTGAPFGFTRLAPFMTQKALPERQRDLCEFIARECKAKDISSFVTEKASAH